MSQLKAAALACLIAVWIVPAVEGQSESRRQLDRTKNLSEEIRQSYERHQADGLKITIYQLVSNQMRPVNPGQSFTAGDRIKIKFESNFDGYVYVINVTPTGERRLLFPRPSSRRNQVRASQQYDIPTSGEFLFDKDPGLEVLQILMSRSQVYFLEAILDRGSLKSTHVPLDKGALRSLRNLTGSPTRLKGSGIATEIKSKRTAGLQTRILTLEPRREGSILVLASAKGTSRFAPGELSVFEIRLNHY